MADTVETQRVSESTAEAKDGTENVTEAPEETEADTERRPYSRILVPLDGSKLAERAIGAVEPLARAFHGRLILLRATRPVREIVAQLTPIDIPSGCDPNEMAEIEAEQTKGYLERVASSLREGGVDVACEQREGHPADVICAVAREEDCDLIAITTHGRGGWRHLIFGSVAEETIRHACCPVLVVHITD